MLLVMIAAFLMFALAQVRVYVVSVNEELRVTFKNFGGDVE